MADHEYLLVAALDFGTTYSGYGFSFRDKPETIMMNKNWAKGFISYKTPTSVLVDENGQFLDMGYDAETRYDQPDLDIPGRLHLFRHFKMLLYGSEDLTLDTEIEAVDGTKMPAKIIFAFAIRFLRLHMMRAIKKDTGIDAKREQIFWVLTVPAIWNEKSKKFMKEAARLGGCIKDLESSNIILALEPEAASLCCRRLNIARYDDAGDDISFPEGTKYLILDCGGGTIDLTAHQVEPMHKVQEILPADGGPWGGTCVDRRFSDLLQNILGKDFLDHFKSSQPSIWLQLMSSFESVKKEFCLKNSKPLNVFLPFSMFSCYAEMYGGKPLEKAIKEYSDPNVSFKNGILVLQPECVQCFFGSITTEIKSLVREKLNHPTMADCRYLFMVGGFSESSYLQEEIRKEFGENGERPLKILIPGDTQLAIIKGAVLFGSYTDEISARVARKTYGFDTFDVFDPKIHNVANKEGNVCYNIFEVLVEKGEHIMMGHEVEIKNYPADSEQTIITKKIYAIDGKPKNPVQYVNDFGVQLVGTLSAEFPELASYDDRHKTLKIITRFDSTEITVKVMHVLTGQEVTGRLNFLSG